MDLRKRLAQFDRLTQQRQERRNNAGANNSVQFQEDEACRRLGLQRHRTAHGSVWLRETVTKTPAAPRSPVPDFTAIFTRSGPQAIGSSDILFLDTETTGLVGGTGSLAFMIGLGWWSEGRFHVRQYFLPGPGQEISILHDCMALAKRFRVVVTFNGNGFDLPLLRTRALMARLKDPYACLVSWDLLPAVRRLWGRRLADCRQQTLEQEICGRHRGLGDIEGALIPQVYFRYLREGDTADLSRVLRHNYRDMVGMAHLFRTVTSRTRTLTKLPARGRKPIPWQDAWANGRIWEERGDRKLAAGWLTAALKWSGVNKMHPAGKAIPESFFRDAVRILKRTAAWSQVEATIKVGLRSCGERPWLHREAAIMYEHRLGNLQHAWIHAQKAKEPVRVARLSRKLKRVRLLRSCSPPSESL